MVLDIEVRELLTVYVDMDPALCLSLFLALFGSLMLVAGSTILAYYTTRKG